MKEIPGQKIKMPERLTPVPQTVVVVDDSGILAGTLTTAGGYRVRRCEEIALQQKLPFVHLVESAGGDLINYTVEAFSSGGMLFGNLAKLSKADAGREELRHKVLWLRAAHGPAC